MSESNKTLLRNIEYKQAFDEWLLYHKSEQITSMQEGYENFLLGNEIAQIKFEKGQGYEAILWPRLDPRNIEVSFILDFLKAKVVSLHYYNYLSDTKTEVMDGGVKLNYERHYLKPITGIKPDYKDYPNYGNIHLENCQHSDNKTAMIKILVTNIAPKVLTPFNLLMRELFAN